MGIAGGALIPLVFGVLSERAPDPRLAYVVMIPCYLIVLYYALVATSWSAGPRRSCGQRRRPHDRRGGRCQ